MKYYSTRFYLVGYMTVDGAGNVYATAVSYQPGNAQTVIVIVNVGATTLAGLPLSPIYSVLMSDSSMYLFYRTRCPKQLLNPQVRLRTNWV